jgi:hypothetical protein
MCWSAGRALRPLQRGQGLHLRSPGFPGALVLLWLRYPSFGAANGKAVESNHVTQAYEARSDTDLPLASF